MNLIRFITIGLIASSVSLADEQDKHFSIPAEVVDMYDDFEDLKNRLPKGYPTESNRFWNSYGNLEVDMRNQRLGHYISQPGNLGRYFKLWMTGYPRESCRIKLHDVKSDEKLVLKFRNDPADHKWDEFKWKIPRSWQNRMVIVHIEDIWNEDHGWFGFTFSDPSFKSIEWQAFFRDLGSLVSVFLQFCLILLPGLGLLLSLKANHFHDDGFEIPLLIAISFCVCYLGFYVYLLNSHIGKIYSLVIFLSSLFGIYRYQSALAKLIKNPKFWLPLVVGLLVSVLIWSSGLLETMGQNTYNISKYRFWGIITPDSRIPHVFAHNVYFDLFYSPMIIDWLSSDRPPLQTSIYLLQRPFLTSQFLQYHTLGVILQSFIFIGATYMIQRIIRSKLLFVGGLSMIIFCGLTLQNGFYVWPKLLAGAMLFFLFALVFGFNSKSLSKTQETTRWILVGTFAVFSMLAHGASFFPLLGMIVVFLCYKKYPLWKYWILAGATFAVIYTPWLAYQKLYDPPGNRLIKWHIGGVVPIDDRGSLETIIDSYSSLTFQKWFEYKWSNFTRLFKHIDKFPELFTPKFLADGFRALKEYSFDSFIYTNGPLGILTLLFLILLFKKETRRSVLTQFFLTYVLAIIFWIFLMFIPSNTFPHHGSYFLNYACILLGCLTLGYLSKMLMIALSILNAIGFYLIWNLPQLITSFGSTVYQSVDYSPLMLVINHSALIILGLLFVKLAMSENEEKSIETSPF